MNEISVNVTMSAVKGTLNLTRQASYQVNLNGLTYSSVFQSVPTTSTGTQLTIASSVTTGGVCYFRNTDSTNYVTIGHYLSGTYYPIIKLEPGEVFIGRLATLVLYAVSNTSPIVLEVSVLND